MAPQWCASVYINHTFVFHFLPLSANVKYAIKQSFIDNFTGRHRHYHHHFLQCRRRRHRHRRLVPPLMAPMFLATLQCFSAPLGDFNQQCRSKS